MADLGFSLLSLAGLGWAGVGWGSVKSFYVTRLFLAVLPLRVGGFVRTCWCHVCNVLVFALHWCNRTGLRRGFGVLHVLSIIASSIDRRCLCEACGWRELGF